MGFLLRDPHIQLNCVKWCSDIIEKGLLNAASFCEFIHTDIGRMTDIINGQKSSVENDF